jgi:sugar-specific transcriptional regulator TrmB
LSVDEKDVAALQRLGLTEYESRIYLAVVRMGSIKASEVSLHGRVPLTKTYGVVRELERRGLLNVTPGKPEIFSVRSPVEVLMPLVARLESGVKESTSLIQRLALAYESNAVVKDRHPQEAREMWIIEGRGNVLAKMNELFGGALKSINYYTSANGLIRAYRANSESLEKARERGVDVRILSALSPENAAVVREMGEIATVQTIEKTFPPQFTNFVSVDSSELLISEVKPDDLSTDRGSDLAVWNRNKLVVGLHDQLFTRLWESLKLK